MKGALPTNKSGKAELRFQGSTASLEVSLGAKGQRGMLATRDQGGLVTTKLTVSPSQLTTALSPANVQALSRGRWQPMLDVLGDTPIAVETTLYETSGVGASLGASEAGTGASGVLDLSSKDPLFKCEITMTPRSAWKSMQPLVDALSQRLRKVS